MPENEKRLDHDCYDALCLLDKNVVVPPWIRLPAAHYVIATYHATGKVLS